MTLTAKTGLRFLCLTAVATSLGACAGVPAARNTPEDTYVSAVAAPARDKATDVLNRYTSMVIDPVDITASGTGHWQGVSEAQRARATNLVHDIFEQAARSEIALADGPTPGTLRLHLIVQDVKLSSPLRASISHLTPIGLVMNMGKSAAGATASKNMGSVTISGELRDAENQKLVASFWTQLGPDPMNISAAVDQDSAMKAAIERSAEKFRAALAKARRGDTPCQSNTSGQQACHVVESRNAASGKENS